MASSCQPGSATAVALLAPLGPHQGRSSDHESAFAFAFAFLFCFVLRFARARFLSHTLHGNLSVVFSPPPTSADSFVSIAMYEKFTLEPFVIKKAPPESKALFA